MADNNTAQQLQEDSVQAGDLSKTLIEYRSEADLDLEQVAEALCLPPSSVQALENEEFSKLPEPPYIRGYLRSYARLAEKDPARVITIYETLRGASSLHDDFDKRYAVHHVNHATAAPIISPARFKLGMLALLLLLLALLTMLFPVAKWSSSVWDKFSQKNSMTQQTPETPSEQEQTLTGAMPNTLPPPVENSGSDQVITGVAPAGMPTDTPLATVGDTVAAEHTAVTDETANTQDQEAATETTEPTEQPADQTAIAESTSPETVDSESQTPPAQEGDTKLKMVFSSEVWLRIQDNDGNHLYEALNQPGSEKEITLSKPMKFRVGNAQGLKLFVNGTEMDINEYIKGSVATFGIE